MDSRKNMNAERYVQQLLHDGIKEPVDSSNANFELALPEWYNEQLYNNGQSYYKKNFFSMFVGMLCGLIAVLAIPSILKVLICTRKSGTPATAYRRYIKTIFHVVVWHYSRLRPGNRAWKSIESVRRTHFFSSKISNKSHCGFITQKDMALTQFGFIGFITLNAKLLGISATDDYLESTIHFWRVTGFMLGIKEEYNLCTDSWKTTKPRLELLMKKVYRPALENTSKEFIQMSDVLIDGLWSFSPFLTIDTYLFFTKRLAGCKGYRYLKSDHDKTSIATGCLDQTYKTFSLRERYSICNMIITHQYLLKYNIVRWYFNFYNLLSLFLIYFFPFLAFRFGIKKSYVRIFK